MVFKDGRLAGKKWEALFKAGSANNQAVQNTMNLATIEIEKLKITAMSSTARVIGAYSGATSDIPLGTTGADSKRGVCCRSGK